MCENSTQCGPTNSSVCARTCTHGHMHRENGWKLWVMESRGTFITSFLALLSEFAAQNMLDSRQRLQIVWSAAPDPWVPPPASSRAPPRACSHPHPHPRSRDFRGPVLPGHPRTPTAKGPSRAQGNKPSPAKSLLQHCLLHISRLHTHP